MKRVILAALTACVLSTAAHAQKSDNGFKFVLGGGLTFGGEELATAQYTNGSTAEIRSGQLFAVHGGIEYRYTDFAVQATVGYHFDRANAQNGSITFSRMPIELLGYYNVSPKFRLGGGLRNSTGAKLEGDGIASNIGSVEFDADLGAVLEGEYMISPNMGIKLRYVMEKFKANNVEIDGNHGGVFFNAYF